MVLKKLLGPEKTRDDVSKLQTWGLIAVSTCLHELQWRYINRSSSIKCLIKNKHLQNRPVNETRSFDFLFTDLGSFVSRELNCKCEKPPNICRNVTWHRTVSATVFSSAQAESFPLRVRPITRTSDPHRAECPTPVRQLHIHPLLVSVSPRHEREKKLRSQFWHSMPAGWAAQ